MAAREVLNLTKAAVESLPPPEAGKRYIVRDAKQPGLELLVTSTRKSFAVRHRIRGLDKVEYVGIGQYPAISIDRARDKAREVIGRHAGGVTQASVVGKRKRDAKTFEEALREFVDEGDASRDRPLKDRTRSDYLMMVRPAGQAANGRRHGPGELHTIAGKRVDSLTGTTLRALHRELALASPTRAGYAMRVVRASLNYHGIRLTDDPFSPTAAKRDRIVLPAAKRRSRVVAPERLPEWWHAATKAHSGDALKLMLLTGMRRGEVTTLLRGDVDLFGERLYLRDTKNREPHTVLLSRQAAAIVRARAANKKDDELLFAGAADPRKSLRAIIDATGIEFSAHDLRRTFATLAAARLPGYVVKKLLNHISGGDVTAAHYVHLDEATLRNAWQIVADAITAPVEAAVEELPTGNVVQIRRRKKAALA